MASEPALFKRFPTLLGKIPWVSLGEFPTPIQKLSKLGAEIGLIEFYCKRDDLTSPEYGGNKVRKLEFLLADVQRLKRKSVLTMGAWGSNHILATTVFSKKLGIKSIGIMVPQSAQEYARKNLLLNFALGCELHLVRGTFSAAGKVVQVYLRHWHAGERPYLLWAGGSTPLGILGYVNAGLEIAEQVQERLLPEPDYIFCAAGSCGTFVGLVLGVRLAGLKTKVIGIRVYDKIIVNSRVALWLATRALQLLRKNEPQVPALKLSLRDFPVLDDYVGLGYSEPTEAGLSAIKMAKELEGLVLESTYTGKCLSGIIDLARKGELKNQVVVFLNSFNSRPLEKLVSELPSWERLPEEFHPCFKES